MKRRIEFELQGLPKGMNGSHGHWRVAAARRKSWRTQAGWAARAALSKLGAGRFEKCRIICTRHSAGIMDFDNLVATFKPIIDGLKDAGVILDDSPKYIVGRSYLNQKAPMNAGFVSVIVEES